LPTGPESGELCGGGVKCNAAKDFACAWGRIGRSGERKAFDGLSKFEHPPYGMYHSKGIMLYTEIPMDYSGLVIPADGICIALN
jgi:hypothetical protein